MQLSALASRVNPADRASISDRDGAPEAPAAPGGGNGVARLSNQDDPILCSHCGRTASNGLSCIGMCVADSGY